MPIPVHLVSDNSSHDIILLDGCYLQPTPVSTSTQTGQSPLPAKASPIWPTPSLFVAPPSISASGSLTPDGYLGYSVITVSSKSTLFDYSTNGRMPSCRQGSLKPASSFILAYTAEVGKLS
jgi:hypothetical protein